MTGGNLGNIGNAFVTVDLDFDRALEQSREAGAKIPPVEINVELDQSQVTREVKTTLDTAERAAGPITPPVVVDTKQATSAVRSALARVSATAGSIPVRVNSASLNKAAAEIRTKLGGAFAAAGSIARSAFIPGLFAVGILGDQIRRGADDAKTLEGSLTGVRASLKGAGKQTGVTEKQIRTLAGSMEDFSSISEESIIAAEEPLTRFGVVSKKTLPATTKLLLDTAVGMRQVSEDGELAAGFSTKFARALADPQKGLSLLSRAGVPVSAALKENVKDLVAVGKTGQATALVADLLRDKYGGAANELGQSVPGKLRLATDAFQDARRDLATKILPAIASPIQALSKTIATALNSNREGIAKFVVNIVKGTTRLITFVTTNKQFHGVMRGLVAVIKGVAKGIKGFVSGFAKAFSKSRGKDAKDFGKSMERFGEVIGGIAEKWLPKIGSALGTFIGFVTKTKAGVVALFGFLASARVFGVLRTIGGLFRGIGGIIRILVFVVEAFIAVFGGVVVAIGAAVAVLAILYIKFKTVRKIVNTVIGVFLAMVFPMGKIIALFVLLWKKSDTFRKAIKSMAEGVRNSLKWLRDRFADWRAGIGLVLDGVRDKFRNWREGIRQILQSVRDALGRFKERAKAILDINLFELGKKIIKSLLSGMKEGWNDVKDWLSERASIIRKLKGPIEADRKLLYNEGGAIMGGFFRGLKSRWTGIADWLHGIGGFFKGVISGNDLEIGKILLGETSIADLNKQIGATLGLGDLGSFGGLGGFLHPTSGWSDTLKQVKLIEKLFHVGMTSGLRLFDTVAGPGVSQHTLGQAADFGTSRASFDALTRLAQFASRLRNVFKQVIWLNKLWSGGFPIAGSFIPDHLDHVHLGWQARAAGGQVSKGRPYTWNERGKEILMPSGNGYVMNASRTKELIGAIRDLSRNRGSSRTSNANVTIHTAATDAHAIAALQRAHLGRAFSIA